MKILTRTGYWRRWLSLLLSVALFVLAGLQATGPSHGQDTWIGVATKVITGIVAVVFATVLKDVMALLHSVMESLDEQQPPGRPRDRM